MERTEGPPRLPLADGACDRFLSTYVLDLVGEDEIRVVLGEARRVLAPGGRLCLTSLTFGRTIPSRAVCGVWVAIHRPLRLQAFTVSKWKILHGEVVCTFGICTEVLVAE